MKKQIIPSTQVRLSGQASRQVTEWAELTNISQNKVADLVVEAGFKAMSDPSAGQMLKGVLGAAVHLEKERQVTTARLRQAQLALRLAKSGGPARRKAVQASGKPARKAPLAPVATSQSVLP